MLSIAFTIPGWLLVGVSMRRWAQWPWHRSVGGRLRGTLLSLIIGLLCLAAVLLVFFQVGTGVRFAGFAFWALYVVALGRERLGLWPFQSHSTIER